MDQNFFQSWKRSVPRLGVVLERMQEKTIVALGINPYPRIIPALFLKNYIIYSVKDSVDLDTLRSYVNIFCLEEKFPKIAPKVHSTSYLLGNFAFHAFLKSRRKPFRLSLNQTTPPIIEKLKELKVEWIGNPPETFDDVMLKGNFRELLERLNLPRLLRKTYLREEFLSKTFEELYALWQKPFVIQRADLEVGGEQGTLFVHTKEHWERAHEILSEDTRFKMIQVSLFVKGDSLSMLGCVTHLGILTSMLQLQLIDIPEVLQGNVSTGSFLGHDWMFKSWEQRTQNEAQRTVETIGEHLKQKGFRGIFGIDFIYNKQTKELLPLECNPRPTGALPPYSLMTIAYTDIPPLEFFQFMAQLGIEEDFDFEAVNKKLKQSFPVSHISLSPKGILKMPLTLASGIYSYSFEQEVLTYRRPGAFLHELKDSEEFLIIDTVPRKGAIIVQNVPRSFKIIFPRSIASSSYSLQPNIAKMVDTISRALRKST